MRAQKFFGRITIYLLFGIVISLLLFVFSSAYSIVVSIQLSIANTKGSVCLWCKVALPYKIKIWNGGV
jgi:hypothetical protein